MSEFPTSPLRSTKVDDRSSPKDYPMQNIRILSENNNKKRSRNYVKNSHCITPIGS